MKKNIKFVVVFLSFLLSTACSTDDDDMNPDIGDYNYTMHVKPIIDGHCLVCHDSPPVNGAPMALTSFEDVKLSVENRNLILRIENGSMPPGGSLNPAQIKTIKDWVAGGFKQ